MTTQLAPTPVFKAFDNNGSPLANGLLYSYIAGTTTPQATYTDSTGNTPNTNPVVLNARGEANVWLNPAQGYKLVLTDSLGNQIWSVDGIIGPVNINQSLIPAADNTYSLGSPSAAWAQLYLGANHAPVLNGGIIGYWPQTAPESAAGVTPTNYSYPAPWVDRYGNNTIPGTTDMTAAVQAAISVANAMGTAAVIFQPTTYVISSPITHARGVSLECPYGSQAKLDFSQIAVSSGSPKTAITVTGNNAGPGTVCLWRNLWISGNRAALSNPPTYTQYLSGVDFAVNVASFENVQITGFDYAVTYSPGAYIIDGYNAGISYNNHGVYFNSTSSTMGERISYHGGSIANNNYGIYNNLGGLHFNAVSIDQNVLAHVLDNITAVGGAQGSVMEFNGCHVENETAFSPQGNVRFTNHGLMRFNGGQISDQVSSMFVNAAPAVLTFDNDVLYRVGESLGYTLSGTGAVRVNSMISSAANVNWRLSKGQSGIGNSDFETGALAPWTITVGTNASVSNADPHSGSYSLALAPTSSSAGTAVASPRIAIPAGMNQVALSFWGVNKNTAQPMTAQIVVYDLAGAQLNNQPLALATGQAAYALNQTTTPAPPGGGYAVVEFTFPAGSDTANMCYVDDVYVNVQ